MCVYLTASLARLEDRLSDTGAEMRLRVCGDAAFGLRGVHTNSALAGRVGGGL